MGDEILGVSKCLLHFFSLLPGHPVFQHRQRLQPGAGGGRGWCWREGAGTAPHSQVPRLFLQLLVFPCASSTGTLPGCSSKGEVLLSELYLTI